MKSSTLERIAPLLAVLRSYSSLHEVRQTVFPLKNRDFIHFHELDDEGVVADVRAAKGWFRMSVATQSEQAEFMERIESTLAALEVGSSGRRGTQRYRHRDED